MSVTPFIHAAALLVVAVVSAWMAAVAFARPHVPGGRTFGWMNVAMAWWCLTGALHAVPQGIEIRILWAKMQLAGIAAVPPLWLLFAANYARARWPLIRSRRRLLALAAVAMFLAGATNGAHHLYWTLVEPVDAGLAYHHGPLFWAAVAWNYVLLAVGAVTLLRAVRMQHGAFTGQAAALIGATLCPWVSNVLYLYGAFPAGFDPTPFAFVASALLITWGLYAHHLFDVVPAARAAVFERMADAVFVLDRAYRVIDANAAAVALLEPSNRIGEPPNPRTPELPNDAIGKHPSELLSWWSTMPKPPAPDEPEPTVAMLAGRILEVQVSPFIDGRSGGSLLRVRDVTARRKAEFERKALEGRLREQERLEGLTVLAAGLAHDFNNMLAAILGNADYLVATSPQDSERRASAEAVAVAAQHAADMVSQIVAFSGQGRAIVTPVSLEDAVGDVLRALQRTTGERALVTHESHPDLPLVPGDQVQLRQAVLALLTNAVDAAAPTHGSVEVMTGRETLDAAALSEATYSAARAPGEFVFVDVRDEGAGIPPDVLPRVFEPFFSTREMGRGLGLAAVHGIVRGHEGAIRIWTSPGEGTRVRLWFPLS